MVFMDRVGEKIIVKGCFDIMFILLGNWLIFWDSLFVKV